MQRTSIKNKMVIGGVMAVLIPLRGPFQDLIPMDRATPYEKNTGRRPGCRGPVGRVSHLLI